MPQKLPAFVSDWCGKVLAEVAEKPVALRRKITDMYLITWNDQECVLEASLGGRVTLEEAMVVFEELQEVVEGLDDQPYLLVLDYSKAKGFDGETEVVVGDIRDYCLRKGAEKVVSVVRDEDEIPLMTSWRLQNVLEGLEDFVTDPSVIEWTPMVAIGDTERLAA